MTAIEVAAESATHREPPALACRPIGAVALATAAVLLVRAGRYGYGGDELYFIAAGRHPSAGYADQGPVVPLLAALADRMAPGSLVALRIPVVFATVVAIVLAAVIARELG